MIGRILGRYRLLGELSDETAEAYYRAEDTLVERQVALRLVPAEVAADGERLARIRECVDRAAAFIHPDVATVYGLEEAEGERFVTSELAAGKSLSEVLRERTLSLGQAVEIAATLLDVLASAQLEGVVHGSLRPGDVILRGDGSVTIRGFGLHELRQEEAQKTAGAGPADSYRPPESGAGLRPDHRTDLYAFGRLLREMAAAGGAGEPPSEPVAAALRQIVEPCLAEDPARRPRSAAELRPRLEELQLELLRQPEPEPEWPEVRRGLGAKGRRAALAVAALLALVVGWIVWRASAPEPVEVVAQAEPATSGPALLDLAVLPLADAGEAGGRPLAVGFSSELNRLLVLEPELSVLAASSVLATAELEVGPQELGRALGVAHLLEGSLLWQEEEGMASLDLALRLTRTADGALLWSDTYSGFLDEILDLPGSVAASVARRLGASEGPVPQPLTGSLGAYTAYLEATGRMARAGHAAELRRALAGFETATLVDPTLLQAHARQARLRLALHPLEPSGGHLEAARQVLAVARSLDAGDPEVRRAQVELELATGDPALADETLTAALARLPEEPGLLRAVARIDRRMGRWEEAAMRLAAARRLAPLDLELLGDLVETLAWRRQFSEALEHVERTAAIAPAGVPALLEAELRLRGWGDTERARAILEGMPEAARADPRWLQLMLVLDLCEGAFDSALERLSGMGLDEPARLIARGWIQRHAGWRQRAAADFDRARKQLEERLEAEPEDAGLSAALGQAYAGSGGGALGIRMGRRAVVLQPVTEDAVAGVRVVEQLAGTYVLAGDNEGALDELGFLLGIPSPVTVALLRLDPTWKTLREGPEFWTLLEHFGP